MKLLDASIIARGRQSWIETITQRYHAKLRILHAKKSAGRNGVLQLVEIIVDQKSKQGMLKEVRADSEVLEVAVTESTQGRLVGLIRANGLIMRCIADSDCFLVYASNAEGAEIEWRVLGTRKSLKGLLGRLTRRDIDYRVGRISETKSKRGLTPRREWLLKAAFEKGYFDYPKGVHIRELAKDLGISAPTLFESLRKSEKRILEGHFAGSGLWT